MLIAEIPRLRGIVFAEDDVPYDIEPGFAPRGHERVHLVPAVERNTQAVGPEHAVHLPERRFQPGIIVIIRHPAAGAVAVVHEVRWIGEDEIYTRPGHATHYVDAVAAGDVVMKLFNDGFHFRPRWL